jgi:hypothetical protein
MVTNRISAWQAGRVAYATMERLIQDKLVNLIKDGKLSVTSLSYLELVIELGGLTTLKALQAFLIKLTSLGNI